MFGVIILIMHYEFASWSDMWSSRSQCTYIESIGIGKISLTSPRFDNIWSRIWFSILKQPRIKRMKKK